MVAAAPEAYVADLSKAKRSGIFIDYFHNNYAATSIAIMRLAQALLRRPRGKR
jgi:DNA primase